MKGLLKNNFYAARSNGAIFAVVMLLLGLFVIAMDNDIQTLLDGYMLLSMTGFSIQAITSLRKESAGKWNKYKLTVPVKRSDIVKSYFISQLVWLFVGILFAGAAVSLSILLHGYPFDRNTDILMLFIVGISISLFMGAVFFPLFYLGGEERNEAFLVISLLCGIGIVAVLATAVNMLFGPHMTTLQVIAGGAIILISALLAFLLSYPLTVGIFQKKEF
ncbi:MAG: ABC-2 transporter permease [Eubacteriales bacterium]|nr:ABC-2 transporter permease [Eubacteriales bacterium]